VLERPSHWLTTVALVAGLGVAVRSQEAVEFRRWLDVAHALARQAEPAGVVMCDLPGAARGEELDPFVRLAGTPTLAACAKLNASLFQRQEGGVLHVRTIGEPRLVTELLHRSIQLEAQSDLQAIDAVSTIVNAIRGDRSSGASASMGAAARLVRLRAGRTTVMQALDDVVRQAPGTTWWLTYTPAEDGQTLMLGLVDGHGGSGSSVFPGRSRSPSSDSRFQIRR